MSQRSPKLASSKFHFSDILWDLWCIVSIIGIWPRFIEPNVIATTKLALTLPTLPEALKGLKIIQFSDLHLQEKLSDHFLHKLKTKIIAAKPDILVFTGDFICNSKLSERDRIRLSNFLNSLTATYGCFAVFGNHDYAQYVSVNSEGNYDLLDDEKEESLIKRGFARLFSKVKLTKHITARAQSIGIHPTLKALLEKTPFKLLDNESELIKIKESALNICGLGEYILNKTDPVKAFQNYRSEFPGIILLHNPDGIRLLENYPGEVILSGHTHGGQVNLPWMWKKFTLLENNQLKRGLISHMNRWLYVNRGIGSIFTFRWFAVPEILVLSLK